MPTAALSDHLLDTLPVGVVVLTPRYAFVYANRMAESLWDAASVEFGSREEVFKAFVESCRAEQGKERWFSRIVAEASTRVVSVHAGRTTFRGDPSLVYVLAPAPAAGPAGSGMHSYGPLRIDEDCSTVMFGRAYVPATATEFKLLMRLCAEPWRLMTKEELLRDVWGVRTANTRTLDVTVNRLRAKLAAHACPPGVVRTVHGQGYLFDPTLLVRD